MVHWRSNRAAAGKIYYLIAINMENPAPAHIGVTLLLASSLVPQSFLDFSGSEISH